MIILAENFNAKMKRVLLFLLMVFLLTSCGSIGYSYIPLTTESCRVNFSAIYHEGKSNLFVEIQSDRLIFRENPILKIKILEGETFTLEGRNLSSSQKNSGVVINNMVIPTTVLQAKALFPITEEEISMLNNGVAKIRISTVPIAHERTFESDIIGEKLYKQFQKKKIEEESF
ncbi:hypothetical protein [Porphyromonas endodontalis]|uniref:hypothetical protein n=1 Tax=Porphyromonas endodontalis TaxID=28124 RepID=UPI0028EB24CB|nr:hypothetical protein [Porphyromonas endodontalis]